MWSFWCLLAWFPALPAATPGSINAWRRLSQGPPWGQHSAFPWTTAVSHLCVLRVLPVGQRSFFSELDIRGERARRNAPRRARHPGET